jgi:AcrR family transcriptional regulator
MLAFMSDARDRLVEVTARIFAEAGYHGTTTRRIAQEADVNEVTLFRHFGSKEALIREALRTAALRTRASLDPESTDPAAELHRWALAAFHHFYERKDLVRRVMGEMVERPEIAPSVCEDTNAECSQLERFFTRLQERGLARGDVPARAAAGMLLGALISNALWRDFLPQVPEPAENVRLYVDLVLKGIGLDTAAPASKRSGGRTAGNPKP